MSQIAEITGAEVVHPCQSMQYQNPNLNHSGGPPGHKVGRAATLFWGISGGTLLSVGGFIALTLYQQNNETLTELRNDLRQLTMTSGDQVKREEMRGKFTTLWGFAKDLHAANLNTNKELQKVISAHATQMERANFLEQRWKAGEEERKELVREIQRLRERLATVEGRQGVATLPSVGVGQ